MQLPGKTLTQLTTLSFAASAMNHSGATEKQILVLDATLHYASGDKEWWVNSEIKNLKTQSTTYYSFLLDSAAHLS